MLSGLLSFKTRISLSDLNSPALSTNPVMAHLLLPYY